MKRKLFLSSTNYDMANLRKKICEKLKKYEDTYDYKLVEYQNLDTMTVDGKSHAHDICLDSVGDCSIVVLVVNKRYGEQYSGTKYPEYKGISVTHAEVKLAILKKMLFITIVNKNTFDERRKYKRSNKKYKCQYVDKPEVFSLIDEVQSNKYTSNWIESFASYKEAETKLENLLQAVFKIKTN